MRLSHLLFIFIIFAGTSCIDDALFNSGNIVTKTIDLSSYETIEAESTFDIEIVPDSTNKVFVTCGENLQPFIKISVSDNVLHLKHEIKNNWSRKYDKVKLVLHTQPFSIINVRKPVRIFNRKIYKAPSFAIVDFMKYCELDVHVDVDYCLIAMSSDNFGQYKVKGKSVNTDIWGWGSCSVRADSLVTTNCRVLHRGIGNLFVNVTGKLDVEINSEGNVFYSGNPSQILVKREPGAGNLFKY